MPLLIAILAVPLIEIAGFILVGGWLGVWPTLGLVMLSGVAGVAVFQMAGRAMALRVSQAMEQRAPPMADLFHGFCLVAAAILLIIPGFFTDLVALLLLFPPARAVLGLYLWRFAATRRSRGPRPSNVIDGDFEDVTPKPAPKPAKTDQPARRTPIVDQNLPPNPSSPWRKD